MFQQHLLKLEALRVEAANEAEKAKRKKPGSTKKKTPGKPPPDYQITSHPPVVKASKCVVAKTASKNIIQTMMNAENIQEGGVDPDLLLS